MAVSTVAFRYAKSLLDLAQEKGLTEEIHKDMLFFRDTLDASRPLALALKNPIIRSDKKSQIVKLIFANRVNPVSMAFFNIIARKNREAIIDAIADEYIRLYDQMKGVGRATVVTTMPLTEELRSEFKAMVAKATGSKQVELKEKVDEKIIGGYILRIDDQQVDASLRSQLNNLKLQFLN